MDDMIKSDRAQLESKEPNRSFLNSSSEILFWTLVQNSPDMITLRDMNDLLLYISPQCESVVGYTADKFTAQEMPYTTYHDDKEEYLKKWELLKKEEKPIRNLEYRIIDNKGELRWLSHSANIIKLGDKVECILSNITNITERKRAEESIIESEKKYRFLFNNAEVGMFRTRLDGSEILEFNKKSLNILNFTLDEIKGKPSVNIWADKKERVKMLKILDAEGAANDFECGLLNKQGEVRRCIISLRLYREQGILEGSIIDITERKQAEEQLKLFAVILEHINKHNEWRDLIGDILKDIKLFTGFDAFGIRLKEGMDYTYYVQDGFTNSFIKQENFLCSKNRDGHIVKDENGLPVLVCTCGLVLSGKVDKTKPYATAGGSIWTNKSTDFLRLLSEDEPRSNPRNTCIHSGYMSIGLIPIQTGEEVIGLLQLNDKQPGRFTPEYISFFEKIGTSIGIAFAKMKNEEKIKESEEQYRLLFDNATEGILVAQKDMVVFANPMTKTISGFSNEELLSVPFIELIYPDDRDMIRRNYMRRIKGEIVQNNYNFRILTKDKVVKWIEINAISFEWIGKPATLNFLSDITDRIKAEKKEKDNIAELKTLSDLAFNLIEAKTHDRIIDLLEDNLTSLIPNAYFIISLVDKISNTISLKRIVGIGNRFSEIVKKTGINPYDIIIPLSEVCDRELESFSSKSLNNYKDGLYGLSGKKIPKASAKIIEKMMDIRSIYTIGFMVEGELLGELTILMKEDREPPFKRTIETIVNQISVVLQRRNMEEQIRTINIGLEQKVKDRTAKLESANKELESFAYSVSHDLRSPLRHIEGFIDLLHKETANDLSAEAHNYLNIIASSAKEMGVLIDELLAFSRMSRADLVKSGFSTEILVQEVMAGFERETQNREVIWKIGNLPEINGDLFTIKQAWVNLISNALKYTSKNKTAIIEIDTFKNSAKENVFYIKDNGVGFDTKYADKLFNIFQRLHLEEDFPGIGIGLANVHKIIEKHGGRIWAEGEVGKGATFYFTLP